MNPMTHTGNSANVSWYAERHQGDQDYLYAEVLRDDLMRHHGGIITRRSIPEYHFTVKRFTRSSNWEVARWTYQPARKPRPLVLGNRTVTRLVREHLEAKEENDHDS
jgi:hypothetical protein